MKENFRDIHDIQDSHQYPQDKASFYNNRSAENDADTERNECKDK